eukprot:2201696-Rhodomonas_salina.1
MTVWRRSQTLCCIVTSAWYQHTRFQNWNRTSTPDLSAVLAGSSIPDFSTILAGSSIPDLSAIQHEPVTAPLTSVLYSPVAAEAGRQFRTSHTLPKQTRATTTLRQIRAKTKRERADSGNCFRAQDRREYLDLGGEGVDAEGVKLFPGRHMR